MMLPPNMMAIAQAAYKNIKRAGSGFTATFVPRMCHTAASFGQASTHAPHFMHDISVSPFAIDSSVSDMVGQLFWQSTQGVQRVRSIFVEYARLVEDRLERAKRAEEGALCSFLGQQGQSDDQASKQDDKDSVLDHPHCIASGHVFRYCLEGAEPHAVRRFEQRQ